MSLISFLIHIITHFFFSSTTNPTILIDIDETTTYNTNPTTKKNIINNCLTTNDWTPYNTYISTTEHFNPTILIFIFFIRFFTPINILFYTARANRPSTYITTINHLNSNLITRNIPIIFRPNNNLESDPILKTTTLYNLIPTHLTPIALIDDRTDTLSLFNTTLPHILTITPPTIFTTN